jgi:hypothetical protein
MAFSKWGRYLCFRSPEFQFLRNEVPEELYAWSRKKKESVVRSVRGQAMNRLSEAGYILLSRIVVSGTPGGVPVAGDSFFLRIR